MFLRWMLTLAVLILFSAVVEAQVRRDTASLAAVPSTAADPQTGDSQPPTGGAKWRTPAVRGNSDATVPAESQPLRAVSSASPNSLPSSPRQPIARATKGSGTLPNDAGQEWWDYDISPYTARVTSTNRPEQAIRDWILRETGYEAWHGDTLALLSANHRTLSVYHTPQMQAVVQEMVDRFVNTEAESCAFGMRVITVTSPDWRVKAHRMLHPIAAQTPAVQAWLMAKEDASLMLADLARRNDFQEHSTPHLLVNNGQSTVVAKTRARNYIKDVVLRSDAWPGYEPQTGQLDEGFKIEFHPLLSLDGKVIDAILKCEIDQIERLVPVMINVPTAVDPRQRQKVEVPQAIAARMHERFRWPADQVLLISLGVVPTPVPAAPASGLGKVPLFSPATRADLLVFVESKGKLASQPTALQPAGRPASSYQNRYYRGISPADADRDRSRSARQAAKGSLN